MWVTARVLGYAHVNEIWSAPLQKILRVPISRWSQLQCMLRVFYHQKQFNVPLQHKYGYISNKKSGVESSPYPVKEGQRCMNLNPGSLFVTISTNVSICRESRIDDMLVSKGCFVKNFVVLDPDVNFSDHLPLLVEFSMSRIHLSVRLMHRICTSRWK